VTVPDSIGPFEVSGLLGEGGMGRVYRARDPRLGRDVAVKVLPAELTEDADRRQRLVREARAAAKLNHPGITTILEIGESDGATFLALELVEGETLADLVARGPLAFERVLEIGTALADALAYAHAQGVIHRDLKLANVMVDASGRAKLLDFGLAKLDDGGGDPGDVDQSLTMPGQVLGSPTAMSPEQAAGKRVDERSDVFSLGSLLHELCTGRPPFRRDTVMETVTAVIHERPPAIRATRKDVPVEFERVLERAMRKSTDERHGSMAELHAALASLGGAGRARHRPYWAVALVAVAAALWLGRDLIVGADPPDPPGAGPADALPSIAVLPFECIAPSPSEDELSFAAGLHADVRTQLSRVAGMRVVATSSVLTALEARDGNAEVAAALGGATLLEGSVQRGGDSVRINVTLVDAASGGTVWSDRYDRPFTVEDLLTVQADVAAKVARALDAQLSDDEATSLAALPTDDTEAYTAYLRAQAHMVSSQLDEESIRLAMEDLRTAIDADEDFARARAFLGSMILLETWLGDMDPARRAEADAQISRALELDPEDPEVLLADGLRLYQARDYGRATAQFEALLSRSPNHPVAWTSLAALRRRRGDFEGSLQAYTLARRLDPLDVMTTEKHATTLAMTGNRDEALKVYRQALAIHPRLRDAAVGVCLTRLMAAEGPEEAAGIVAELLAEGHDLAAADLIEVGFAARRFDVVREAVASMREKPGAVTPTQERLLVAEGWAGVLAWVEGDAGRAREAFAEALVDLDASGASGPLADMARSVALAGVGRVDEAIERGEAALEALPPDRDAIVHPTLQLDFALALVLAGERDRAVDVLEDLAAGVNRWTVRRIACDARFAVLADHPRWRALVERARG